MSQKFRLADGGRIDRTRPIAFRFDGTTLHGYAGDTLASALLANGIHLVGRSFKYHRPRGILSAGAEESNALVQLREGARTEPNMRAPQVELFNGLVAESQNRWPSVRFDAWAVNGVFSRFFPAGFYYNFDLDFRDKVHHIFSTAVDFFMPFLTSVPFNFRDGHTLDADFVQRFFNIIQFKGLDDGFDLFHSLTPFIKSLHDLLFTIKPILITCLIR